MLAMNQGPIRNGRMVARRADLLTRSKSDVGLGHGHANVVMSYLRVPTKEFGV
jgi:hypothetical protein